MHARAGVCDGVLNHTISGSDIYELRFNGTAVGETGINAALCGTFGCPVVLVTGDDASAARAASFSARGSPPSP
jgi:D-amino peptidase